MHIYSLSIIITPYSLATHLLPQYLPEDVQEYLPKDAQEYLLDEKGRVCQTPFRRNQPILHLQWLKKTRSIKKLINQSRSMTLVI